MNATKQYTLADIALQIWREKKEEKRNNSSQKPNEAIQPGGIDE